MAQTTAKWQNIIDMVTYLKWPSLEEWSKISRWGSYNLIVPDCCFPTSIPSENSHAYHSLKLAHIATIQNRYIP